MLIGFLIITLGFIIWKKQKITLVHGDNDRNVKKEDIKEYTESIGKAYIILGISMFIPEIFKLTNNDIYECIGTIVWMVVFIISMVKIIKTQKKYKTGIWN